jgi:hypothetical protein
MVRAYQTATSKIRSVALLIQWTCSFVGISIATAGPSAFKRTGLARCNWTQPAHPGPVGNKLAATGLLACAFQVGAEVGAEAMNGAVTAAPETTTTTPCTELFGAKH